MIINRGTEYHGEFRYLPNCLLCLLLSKLPQHPNVKWEWLSHPVHAVSNNLQT